LVNKGAYLQGGQTVLSFPPHLDFPAKIEEPQIAEAVKACLVKKSIMFAMAKPQI
jgi:hypothetical protein